MKRVPNPDTAQGTPTKGRQTEQRKVGTLSGATKHCFVWIQERRRSGSSFPLKQNLTRESLQIVSAAVISATG